MRELTIPIRYRPRGTLGAHAPPLSVPSVECLGLTIVSPQGNVLEDDLCDRFRPQMLPDGNLNLVIENVTICEDCALTGRASDGALFRVRPRRNNSLFLLF